MRFTEPAAALAIAVAVGLLILGARWLWAYLAARRTARAEAGATGLASIAVEIEDVPDLAPALQRAARALREGTQPRDAIVSAWVALEETAAESGAARSPADTPTEFTTALLGRTGADPRALLRLREIYRAARFGHRPPTAEDVAAAGDALRRIEETWEGRVSAP